MQDLGGVVVENVEIVMSMEHVISNNYNNYNNNYNSNNSSSSSNNNSNSNNNNNNSVQFMEI